MNECRVVLVRPQYPGNLGATARVMHNFGLTKLVLVDPQADVNDREARRLSTHGEFILDQALIVPSLTAAIADCALVAGTSALTDGVFRSTTAGTARDIMPRVAAGMAQGSAALVFGPEPSGLSNDEVSLCHYLLTIPSQPQYPALNLAQAVAICLYELRMASLTGAGSAETAEASATFAEQDRMFAHLEQALREIHFLYGPKAPALMHALRHLVGRARPTPVEVRLLHGLARQLEWFARHGGAAAESSADL